MLEFTFPSSGQIFDSDEVDQVNIFKELGPKATITDFAILLGGDYHIDYGGKFIGNYWSSRVINFGMFIVKINTINKSGNISYGDANKRIIGGRPSTTFLEMSNITSSMEKYDNGIYNIEYGEYPQQAASKELQQILESLYFNGDLAHTGKTYTTDSRKFDDDDNSFKPKTHIEYLYKGKKYIRVEANFCNTSSQVELSNKEKYWYGDFVWVEVSPIKWLGDKINNFVISEKILFAGIQFSQHLSLEFNSSDIKRFMDKHFSKDIIPSQLSLNKILNIPIFIEYPTTSDIAQLIYNKVEEISKTNELTDEEKKKQIMEEYISIINRIKNDTSKQKTLTKIFNKINIKKRH